MTEIRRIYITGGPISGKFTLATKISETTGFPVFEIDWLLWTDPETGERVSKEERKQVTSDIAEKTYLDSRWHKRGLGTKNME